MKTRDLIFLAITMIVIIWSFIRGAMNRNKKNNGVCPQCRQKGATISGGKVKCINPACQNYNMEYAQSAQFVEQKPYQYETFTGSFNPGAEAVTINYRNFRGDDRRYTGNRKTIHNTGDYISLCVMPQGKRITLKKKYIKNISEIERLIPEIIRQNQLTTKEKQLLGYYNIHDQNNPVYQELVRKYPEWQQNKRK